MQIRRRAAYTATPWKNGGGVTHEALRVPSGSAAFDWRVSVAEVATPGPFSEFAGYIRFMVLLSGGGVRLSSPDGWTASLSGVGSLVEFDGARPIHCELVNGPCVDLNLMVAKTFPAVEAWVEEICSCYAPQDRPGALLIFPIAAAVNVACPGVDDFALGPNDLAISSSGETPVIITENTPALVFFARLDDNSR